MSYKIILNLFFILLFTGCITVKKTQQGPDITWPPPPDKARIKYTTSIYGNEVIKKSIFTKIIEAVIGENSDIRFVKPYGVFVDKFGKIFVTDTGSAKVIMIDRQNQKFKIYRGQAPLVLRTPVGIYVDEMENIYISDAVHNKIIVLNKLGEMILVIGKQGELGRPSGIYVDENNKRIYIVDVGQHNVKIYSLDGSFIKAFGQRGSADGQFNYPTNIWVDKNGKVYVTDTLNFRIQIFDRDGKFIRKYGELGKNFGNFEKPKGIAVNSEGHIYVSDAGLRLYQIFDQNMQLLTFVGSYGMGAGEFQMPAGICIDRNDNIYVVDQLNKRIDIFEYIK